MVRKRRTISYPAGVNPGLDEILEQLKSCRGSPYWNRSLSDIGGMILFEAAQAEFMKYSVKDDPNRRNERDPNANS